MIRQLVPCNDPKDRTGLISQLLKGWKNRSGDWVLKPENTTRLREYAKKSTTEPRSDST